MKVYIEYVLIDNLVIDYLLLKATFAVTGYPYSKGRLFLCAFLGSLFALLYPLIPVGEPFITISKILFGLFLTFISSKLKNAKRYYITTIVFLLLTFLTGGVILGVLGLFNIKNVSEVFIALIVLPVYAIIKFITYVIKSLYKQKEIKNLTRKVKVNIFGVKKDGVGFFDTGNGLYYKDTPVIVCTKKFFNDLLSITALKNIEMVTFNTVGGKENMQVIKCDSILIYNEEKENIFNNVAIGVSKNGVGVGYDLILHPALMEKNYDSNVDQEIKKVS